MTPAVRNILLLTSIYPAIDFEKGATPVLHYFAKEWVKIGYNVLVIHYPANFPRIIMKFASLFKNQISSKSGAEIRTLPMKEFEYELDGVKVKRFPLLKYRPHGKFAYHQIEKAYVNTVGYCALCGFVPDVIISHWVNPQLEIMRKLKLVYNVPTCYVAHLKGHDLLSVYSKQKAKELLSGIDIIGFRSEYIKKQFTACFDYNGPSFQCYSGIPRQYVLPAEPRGFEKISKFIFVGTLIARKNPVQLVPAINAAYGNEDFSVSFIGRGAEAKKIKKCAKYLNIEDKVHLLGYMERNQVLEYLKNSDVFIMISRKEAFGLVYLEAMATGCITIAAREEGFDGIIEDGVNGFLCEAGNEAELSEIITKIKTMSPKNLQQISKNAIETAIELTDDKVAKRYLEAIETIFR